MDTKEMILTGSFEDIRFQGEVIGDQLVLNGLLASQMDMDEIPVGIYVLEKDGTLVRCNTAAIAAWGRTPVLGSSEKYCGAHRLRYPSGEVMPHEKAPPAVVINNGGTVRNADVICEQPDGTRLLALVNVFPVRNSQDEVVGAVNVFRHNTSKTVPGISQVSDRSTTNSSN